MLFQKNEYKLRIEGCVAENERDDTEPFFNGAQNENVSSKNLKKT